MAFIDVRPHNQKNLWYVETLITEFIDNWADQSKQWEASLSDPGATKITAPHRKLMRDKGINCPVLHNG